MRKALWLFVVILLAVTAMADELCVDSDDGGGSSSDSGALEMKGDVRYGITTKVDTCLTSENGVSTNDGVWLLEYFCDNDQRESKAYNCVDLGYMSCYGGRCNGTLTAAQQAQRNASQQEQEESHCGNKIVEKDKGENCDPPGSICFGESIAEYGTCRDDCTCKVAEAAKKAAKEQPQVCGDGVKHPDEECEEDDHCGAGYVCSSCSCVKELTPEEIEALKQEAKGKGGEDTGGVDDELAKEVDDKYKIDEPPEVNLSGKNFSDDPGIKATSGIANFFKKFFGWIAALFR